MKDAEKEKIALFRYSIIAPLITGTYEGTNHSFYYAASEKMYENTKGETVKLHPYTIYRWYRIYQEKGFDKRIQCLVLLLFLFCIYFFPSGL